MAQNFSVKQMVYMAYDIDTDDRIEKLPSWTDSARFDLQAKLENEKAHQSEMDRSRVIMRALLADRFHLKTHYEKQTRPVYALIVGKQGSKVQTATAADHLEMSIRPGDIHLRATTMAPLIQGISLQVKRPVIDQTSLTGLYNIDIKCASDQLSDTDDSETSIFTALREQLGLRLVPTKSLVEVLVIDRVEPPSDN